MRHLSVDSPPQSPVSSSEWVLRGYTGDLDAETKRFRVILAPGFPITLSFPPQ